MTLKLVGGTSQPHTGERWTPAPFLGVESTYRLIFPRMLAFSHAVSPPGDAEDVVHDALLRYLQRMAEQGEDESVREAMLMGMIRDIALERSRRVERRTSLLQFITGPSASARRWMNPVRPVEDSEIAREVERVLVQMPRRWREVWVLARDHGMRFAEIGGLLGISASTARANLAKACSRMRRELAGRGVVPRS